MTALAYDHTGSETHPTVAPHGSFTDRTLTDGSFTDGSFTDGSTALDLRFDPSDDVAVIAPARPELRLIDGGRLGYSSARAARPSVEVYRRRRFLALVAATVLILGIAWAMGISITSFGAAAEAESTIDQMPAVHVVLPGDSYAAIAADLGARDPLAAGEALRVANGGGELVIGHRLVVDRAVLAASR